MSMGVYIDMEMPINPDMAPTAVWVYPNGYAVVFKDNGKMQQYTQAVPVPAHGRLIDADELVKRIEGIWDCNDMVFKPDDHICDVPADCKGCKWAQTVDCIKRMVENVRTIIQAEEEK